MENTATHFEMEIKSLSYYQVESVILRYFDMGFQSSSDIPPAMEEGVADTYTIIGTKKSGKFSITSYKNKDGGYHLSVSLLGKLHRT